MTAPLNSAQVLKYGADKAQGVTCHDKNSAEEFQGLVFLIHGGYWRSKLHASLMDPLAALLASQGWAVANIEYRRGAESSAWPDPYEDTVQAISAVGQTAWSQGIIGPRIAIGHSVGGQLALLANTKVDAVVALAPLTDLVRTKEEELGEDAVSEYFGKTNEPPCEASPILQLPLSVPTLILHGMVDNRVPLAHSTDYTARARESGSQIELHVDGKLDHFEIINPLADHWDLVTGWMAKQRKS